MFVTDKAMKTSSYTKDTLCASECSSEYICDAQIIRSSCINHSDNRIYASESFSLIITLVCWGLFLWVTNLSKCVNRMAPVKKEKFDSSSFWLGRTMESLSIRPQHWPFYAESSPAILKMPDPWWFTAGRPYLTLTQILQHAQKLLFQIMWHCWKPSSCMQLSNQ